jgi:hypothetical protein
MEAGDIDRQVRNVYRRLGFAEVSPELAGSLKFVYKIKSKRDPRRTSFSI